MRTPSRPARGQGDLPPVLKAGTRGAIRRAAETLRRGGVVVFPTETVYGVGVRTGCARARRRLARMKGRDAGKPFQLLVADLAAALRLCPRMPEAAARLGRACWPGPLTLVTQAGNGRWVGLRVPDHAVARRLIRAAGGALTATSANLSGKPPPTTAADALAALGAGPDLVLDGGPARYRQASTVVRVGRSGGELLREGAIAAEVVNRILGATGASGRRSRAHKVHDSGGRTDEDRRRMGSSRTPFPGRRGARARPTGA